MCITEGIKVLGSVMNKMKLCPDEGWGRVFFCDDDFLDDKTKY